jgi:predicted amidophosphoribosyltransferase
MNEQRLNGNWKIGWALDLHTIKSIPLDDGKFKTTYTEIGLDLNRLKYHKDYSKIDTLANFVIEFMKTRMVTPYINVILPTPPSNKRDIQPVEVIAEKVAESLNIIFDKNYLIKNRNTEQLKEIENQAEREKILAGAFEIRDLKYQNRKVLLFDDLYRSGTTLKEITKILYNVGKVSNVYVVTLTKTRSYR